MPSRSCLVFPSTFLLAIVLLASTGRADDVAAVVEFEPGDHVAYIGNGLPDRMQHAGYLETYIHALHPEHGLVFRNLGFPGDELTTRARSQDFGTPKDWLTKCKADVIFCFFGFNEAFNGPPGLDGFRTDLKSQIDELQSEKYNGESPPRLVFFSPIKHENLNDPNLPDGSENNKNLMKYTEAMREVCAAANVGFVDLYAISEQSDD